MGDNLTSQFPEEFLNAFGMGTERVPENPSEWRYSNAEKSLAAFMRAESAEGWYRPLSSHFAFSFSFKGWLSKKAKKWDSAGLSEDALEEYVRTAWLGKIMVERTAIHRFRQYLSSLPKSR